MVHNDRFARASGVTDDHNTFRDFFYYDDLDVRIRTALQQYNTLFSAEHAWESCKSIGSKQTIKRLADAELDDLMRFARQYERRYKVPYPHTAAFATIQRYGPRERLRRRLNAAQIRILRRNHLLEEDSDGY